MWQMVRGVFMFILELRPKMSRISNLQYQLSGTSCRMCNGIFWLNRECDLHYLSIFCLSQFSVWAPKEPGALIEIAYVEPIGIFMFPDITNHSAFIPFLHLSRKVNYQVFPEAFTITAYAVGLIHYIRANPRTSLRQKSWRLIQFSVSFKQTFRASPLWCRDRERHLDWKKQEKSGERYPGLRGFSWFFLFSQSGEIIRVATHIFMFRSSIMRGKIKAREKSRKSSGTRIGERGKMFW